jgi:hypothetical protein
VKNPGDNALSFPGGGFVGCFNNREMWIAQLQRRNRLRGDSPAEAKHAER